MSLDAPSLTLADLHDLPGPRPVVSSRISFHGQVWDVRTDEVDLGEGTVVTRDYVEHTGAVVVLAAREDRGEPEVLVIRQYRHPIGAEDWELPAGLLDVEGEEPVVTARRELAEEVDLEANTWQTLIDVSTSGGGSTEYIRVYLATGVRELPEAFEREAEEAEMERRWVPLAEVLQLLDLQQQSGVLTVERTGARVDIFFRRGRVDQATAHGVPDEFLLGRFVLDADLMSRADFEAFLESRAHRASSPRLTPTVGINWRKWQTVQRSLGKLK